MGIRPILALCSVAAQQPPVPVPLQSDGAPAASRAGAETPRITSDGAAQSDVVVIGRRLDGSVVGEELPTLVLDAESIRSRGASTIGDLLKILGPSARWGGADEPIALLNGRRVAGFATIAGLPPESLRRIDVLPGPAALKLGYRADRGVVNFVTFDRFRSKQIELRDGTTTEGGGADVRLTAGSTALDHDRRLTLNAEFRKRRAISPGERGAASPSGTVSVDPLPIGDLLPQTVFANAGASWTRPIGSALGTITVSVEDETSRSREESLIQTKAETYEAGPRDGSRSRRTSVMESLLVEGFRGETGLSLEVEHGRSWRSATSASPATPPHESGPTTGHDDRTGSSPDPEGGQHVRESRWASTVVANRPLLEVPAGRVGVTATLKGERLEGHSGRTGGSGTGFDRGVLDLTGTASLPISGPRGRTLPIPGSLSASMTGAAVYVSNFGTRVLIGHGATWSPIGGVQLIWSASAERRPATADQVLTPEAFLPDRPVFDPATGVSTSLTLVSGGNPLLRPERRRTSTLGLSVRPFRKRQFSVDVRYTVGRIRDGIQQPTGLTGSLETSFPARIVRDGNGRPIRVDLRPLNVFGERTSAFSATVFYSGPIRFWRSSAGSAGMTVLNLDFTAVRRVTDVIQTQRAADRLDALDGYGLQELVGRPRFQTDGTVGILRGSTGANLSFRTVSGTVVRADRRSVDVRFGALATFNAELSTTVGVGAKGGPGRGSTVRLRVENLTGARPSARDARGLVPAGLRGVYLDPLGRTVSIAVRGVF